MDAREYSPTSLVLWVTPQSGDVAAGALRATGPELLVHECSDGSQALDSALSLHPSLIVQALEMDGTDGLALIAAYRCAPALAGVPVLLLAPTSVSHDRARFFAAGVADILPTDLVPDELVARVRVHLRSFVAQRQRDDSNLELMRLQAELLASNAKLEEMLEARTRDEAARRKLEAELHRAHRFESVSRLAAGLAHEINTPMQFIHNSVEFLNDAFADLRVLNDAYRALARQLGEQAPAALAALREAEENADVEYVSEQVPRAVERCREGLTRVAAIIRAMGQVTNRSTAEHSWTDLNAVLMATATLAHDEVAAIAHLEMDLGAVPLISCNAVELQDVFSGLISNAAQAIAGVVGDSPARGIIKVSSRMDEARGHVVVRVADTGTGIADAHRPHIFDQFFTTREVGRGRGQSLAQALAVVEQHGGSIGFDSVLGQGTTFEVRLPAAGAAARANVPAPRPEAS